LFGVLTGIDRVYIDHDMLEIIKGYRTKAKAKHIDLHTVGIKMVETIELH